VLQKEIEASSTAACADWLRKTLIECLDAMTIVQTHDAEDAFFYLDQPYVDTNQGRYDGYMQEDFDSQLRLLKTLKGQFLLSSYRNKTSRDFSDQNGWAHP
jgi:DNA adenine methylase